MLCGGVRWYHYSTGRRLQTLPYYRLGTTTSRGSGKCSLGSWDQGRGKGCCVVVSDGITILQDVVSRLYPTIDSELQPPGAVVSVV